MTDTYSSTFGNRITARIPAALLLLVALLSAVPASGQDVVYQFTGSAIVEIDNVLQNGGSPVLTRIEVRGSSGSVTTGANQCPTAVFAFPTCPPDVIEKTIILTSGLIIVDGVSYPLDVTGMTLRRPDNLVNAGDESSFEGVDGITVGGVDLEYPGLAIHWRNPATIGVPPFDDSEFFHYFTGDGGILSLAETDLATNQAAVAVLPTEQNRGGIGQPGYPVTAGASTIEIDFVNVASNVVYSVFTGGFGLDYGDAPDGPYNTLAANAGPSHFFSGSAPRLGALVDTEPDGQPNGDATGDGADEDGVSFPVSIVRSPGQANTAAILIDVQVAGGIVDGWIDWDQDGTFNSGDDYIIPGTAFAVGTHLVPVTIPAGVTTGTTFGRFRISTSGVGVPIGAAADGEVEDYEVVVLNGASAQDIDVDVSLAGGSLVQPITIWQTPGGDTEIFDGTPTTLFRAPQSAVDEINVTGTPAADDFIVDYINGKVANGMITIDGGLPAIAPGDQITLNNGTQDTIEHEYTNANDGFIRYSDSPGPPFETIAYLNLEPITDNLDAVNRIFSFNAAANIVTFDFVPSPGLSVISTSPLTSETTTFFGPTLPGANVVINGNAGADEFDIEPSDEYPITVNGNAPTTLPGDRFVLNTGSLPPLSNVSLFESSLTDGVYSFSGPGAGFESVSYTSMEDVALRFSDPYAFPGSTYEGDWTYPLPTETGISIEPYFNWDIDNWPLVGPSSLTGLQLVVSLNSDLSSPVFTTTFKEDGVTPLHTTPVNEDHFISDVDRDTGIPLLNDTQYYWGLRATLTSTAIFEQSSTFRTIDELKPTLNYPADGLTLHNTNVFNFSWDVAHATSHDLYWRVDVDLNNKASFNGATPAIMGGDIENDDNTNAVDGFTEVTMFSSNNLPTPLLYGSTYTWRVSTMWPVPPTGWVPQEIHDLDETDRMVGLSNLAQFQTVVRAVVPIQSYPVDGHVVYVNDPVLSWYTGGPFNNLTFDVEVYLADGTSTPAMPVPTGPAVCSTTGLTGLQFDTDTFCGGLNPGVTYVWRVRSNLGAQQSAWSGYEEFTTQGVGTNVAVTPSYPVDGLEIYTTAPTLHWFTGTKFGGLDYTVWYLDYTGGAVPASCAALKLAPGAVSLPTVSVTQTQVTGLLPGSDYAWCVTSSNGITPDLDSVVETFHVVGGEDDAFPVASWPIGNPTTYSLTQPLTWYLNGPALGVSTYDVQYCDDAGFTTNCTTVTGLTNTQYTITGLSYGDVVHWRVRANYTGGGQSDWTNPQSQGSFTVTGLLSTLNAVLTYPVGGLILSDDQAVFNWYVNGSTLGPNAYRVQWSYTQNFINIGTVTQTQVTTNQFLQVNNLIPGHTYWWRVAVSNDGGSTFGTYSAAESFVVDAGAVAVQPRVGSPVGGVRVGTLSPTISWILPVAAGEGVTYDLYLSTSPDMSNPTVFEGVANAYYRPAGLEPGTYFWQVRSSGNGVISAFSDVGVFSASAMSTDIEDDPKSDLDEPAQEVLPDAFMLGHNYPNPFNPTTTIQFNVAEAANVNITVYNMLGQQVRTLVSGQMAPGQYSVQWDSKDAAGRAMPSGMYLYRMDAGSFNQTRTLVLMK